MSGDSIQQCDNSQDACNDDEYEPDEENPCKEWLKGLKAERARIIGKILNSPNLNELDLLRAIKEFNRSLALFRQHCPHLAVKIKGL